MPHDTSFKPEEVEILCECLRRQVAIGDIDDSTLTTEHEIEDYLEQLAHGPTYYGWFVSNLPHERMRRLRAIARLAKLGLLTTHQRWGRRLSSIKLTALGFVTAERLAAETTNHT